MIRQILWLSSINSQIYIFSSSKLLVSITRKGKQLTANLDLRKSLLKGDIWILVAHFGIWISLLVTNTVIWSQMLSLCQYLFLFSNLNICFTKVFKFCPSNNKISSKKLNWHSFCHNLRHFVTTWSWPLIY